MMSRSTRDILDICSAETASAEELELISRLPSSIASIVPTTCLVAVATLHQAKIFILSAASVQDVTKKARKLLLHIVRAELRIETLEGPRGSINVGPEMIDHRMHVAGFIWIVVEAGDDVPA